MNIQINREDNNNIITQVIDSRIALALFGVIDGNRDRSIATEGQDCKCVSFFITKCDNYCKMQRLLQNATVQLVLKQPKIAFLSHLEQPCATE